MVQEYIISHKNNTIFNIIAKASTKSVRHLVLKECNRYNNPEDIWFNIQKNVIFQPEFDRLIKENNHNLITIIRNPYDRLVSAYINKFLARYEDHAFYRLQICKDVMKFYNRNMDDERRISFEELVKYIITQKPEDLDGHMRPQINLFDYTIKNNIILKIEEPAKISQKLKECGFQNDFVNYDKVILNHNDKKIDVGECVYNKNYTFFKQMDGVIPKYEYFYNKEIRGLVFDYYKRDFDLLNYNN